MKLIFIYGMPASGKLTVARELSSLTGYKVFHNHLTVDLLLSVFEYGTPEFVELRERMWLDVFKAAFDAGYGGLIFTFVPERTVRQDFIGRTVAEMNATGGEVVFVELHCSSEMIENRLPIEERRNFKKLTSVQQLQQLIADGTFSNPKMPAPQLSIDTTHLAPRESALMIARYLNATLKSEAVPPDMQKHS